jgi:L-lactate dehydrogenase complex protein LldF
MTSTKKQFLKDSVAVTADVSAKQLREAGLEKYATARAGKVARYANYESARNTAAAVKYAAVNNLAEHLEQFTRNIESRGAKVFFASDASRARDYILKVIADKGAKHVIKSKTMTSEEIHLNHAMEAMGLSPVESDLGEYIVQLRGEAPYHFVFPAMHLSRQQVSDLFHEKLGTSPTDDVEELTMIARKVMRELYCTADIGISGANFAVSELGAISITENEGNARLTTSLPKVHIAIVGIEKVLPRVADLALFLPLLASAGAGQMLTCYNSLISGPRRADEPDGPEELHIVLLDNGRTRLLADAEQRDSLHCIRCAACLNVCPIFRNVGGHSYGTTYQGPIGAVITPHYSGLQSYQHLAHASSLCGACTATCPVKIDLHHHLLQLRRNAVREKPSFLESLTMRAFVAVMNHPWLFALAGRIARFVQPFAKEVRGTRFDPAPSWSASREIPQVAQQSFREWYASRRQETRK